MSCLATAPGPAARRWRRSARALTRALAVLALIVGVVAMHSLGVGHGITGTIRTADVMPSNGDHEGESLHQDVVSAVSAVPAVSAVSWLTNLGMCDARLVAPMVQKRAPSHGMGAMCLAVLPILLMLMSRLLGRLARPWFDSLPARGQPVTRGSGRAPPAYLCPSLSRLCILRS